MNRRKTENTVSASAGQHENEAEGMTENMSMLPTNKNFCRVIFGITLAVPVAAMSLIPVGLCLGENYPILGFGCVTAGIYSVVTAIRILLALCSGRPER